MQTSPGGRSQAQPRVREIETPVGLARAHLWRPNSPVGSLVLGHGAGGSAWSAELQALTALTGDGWAVALVEQPWRVAGRKVAGPPAQLDVAWLAVLAALTSGRGALHHPLVVGGRSAGARVACRTAAEVGADAVLALAFPLHPPGRPDRSRAAEALDVLEMPGATPLTVVQGNTDPFGTPQEVREALGPAATVIAVDGGHSFGRDPQPVVRAARDALAGWLTDFAGSGPARRPRPTSRTSG